MSPPRNTVGGLGELAWTSCFVCVVVFDLIQLLVSDSLTVVVPSLLSECGCVWTVWVWLVRDQGTDMSVLS